jgi:hypothetical protein
MLPKPNCCKRPHLHAVRIIDESDELQIAIFRCDACETYWSAKVSALAMIEGISGDVEGFQRLETNHAVCILRSERK